MKKIYLLMLSGLLLLQTGCSKSDDGGSYSDNGGKGGSTARMTIYKNRMYIVDNEKLRTYNISKPENTVLENEQYIGFSIETIYPYNDKLFIGSQSAMYIYDISNPKEPAKQGQVQHIRACDPVVSEGDYAYVTLRNNNVGCGGTQNVLNIYNIGGGTVLNPQLISTLSLPQPNGLSIQGNVVYVCCGSSGLAAVDVSDKKKPTVANLITGGRNYTDVISYNNVLIAYIQGGLAFFDISNPLEPVFLSEIKNN